MSTLLERAVGWRRGLVALLLVMIPGPLFYRLPDTWAWGWLTKRMLWYGTLPPVFYALAVAAWPRRRRVIELVLAERWQLGWLALSLASVLWCPDRRTTLVECVRLLSVLGLAFVFVDLGDDDERLRLLFVTSAIGALSGLVAVAFFPSVGVNQADFNRGVWLGLLSHKNSFGLQWALTAYLAMVTPWRGFRGDGSGVLPWRLVVVTLAVIANVGADSLTSAAALAAGGGAWWLAPRIFSGPPLRGRRLAFVGAGASAAVVGVAWGIERVLGWTGRDLSISGRTQLWPMLLGYWAERPMGYGLGPTWRVMHAPELDALGYLPYHAHNGLLDLGLQLGPAGVLLGLAYAFVTGRACVRAIQRGDRRGRVGAGLWAMVAVHNLTEVSVLARTAIESVVWISLLVIVIPLTTPAADPNQATASSPT